jgi:glucokinase
MPAPQCAVALDVGGTTVDGAIVAGDGAISASRRIASPSSQAAEVIIAALGDLISSLRADGESDGREIAGCGIAMPGPFDYSSGVPHMHHKFASLYGMDLKGDLTERTGLRPTFINDAAAFGLGAAILAAAQNERLMAITLGTGLGVAYVVNGKLTGGDRGIWDIPYEAGILEDADSRRAIENAYQARGGDTIDVASIAKRAKEGDRAAAEAFQQFGSALGDALYLGANDFVPNRFVLGGGIARSSELFLDGALRRYTERSGREVPADIVVEGAALVGAALSVFTSDAPLVAGQ